MKKTIIASTLAVGLGVAAGNAGHADASETQINKAELAQLAQSNDQSLNNSPIQEGAYNVTFDYNGFTYHFESDGTNWSWNYVQSGQTTGQSTPVAQTSQATQTQQQDVSEQASASNNQTSAETVASQQQTSQQQPAQTQQAPQTEQTQQPQQASTSNNTASSGSSVHINGHLQQIAQRESGGDIHAINPSSGAAGKYQFLQSTWDSVAPSEYKGQPASSAPEHVQDAAAQKLYDTAGPSQWVTA